MKSLRISLACGALVLGGGLVALADPSWWTSGSVIDEYATPNNYALANLGQLKHITDRALDEFVGTVWNAPFPEFLRVQNHYGSWELPGAGNYAVANTGQVKAMADPFHSFLMLDRPWGADYGSASNFAVANIGQLKNAFKFEPDFTATGDLDGDGLTNAEEAMLGTNPRGADTDRDGVDDDVDAYPDDPAKSSLGTPPGGDSTGPVITLLQPAST